MENILKNEELLAGLVEVETPEALGALLAQHNIQLEETLSLEEAFKLVKAQESGELNEDALDDVSGGIALSVALGAAAAFTAGAAVISFIGGYAYQKYQNSKKKKK